MRHAEVSTLSVAHIDCDAFYASVEKRDAPELRDKPVIVGGRQRGVVSTACYIARIHGVRSAMPMFQALKLCPDAVVVKPDMRVVCEEIFAPVISISEFDDLPRAFAEVNASPYGLAIGVFTASLATAFEAAHTLRFGGIHINETSSSRVDLMPYGGTKDSGFGREGPKYAIHEMCEMRMVSWTV